MQQNTVYRPFVPMLMLAVSVAVWMGFSTLSLMKQRNVLSDAQERQQIQIHKSIKQRAQLSDFRDQLTKLRDQGNSGATELVKQLETALQQMANAGIKLDYKENAETENNTPVVE